VLSPGFIFVAVTIVSTKTTWVLIWHTLLATTMTQNAAMYQVGPAAYYSIDVECVATGTDHNSRAVGQIALVDQYEQVGVQAQATAATAAAC
jgi:hypothetical protein